MQQWIDLRETKKNCAKLAVAVKINGKIILPSSVNTILIFSNKAFFLKKKVATFFLKQLKDRLAWLRILENWDISEKLQNRIKW